MDEAKPLLRLPTDEEMERAEQRTYQTRFDRRRPKGGRVRALDLLHINLVNHAKLYESDNLQDQRDAVALTIFAVHGYLSEQGFAPLTLAPLMRPAAALAERENNSLDMLFAQRARGGRPKTTLGEHERTGILAELANLWLRIHADQEHPQKVKLAQAARNMHGRWFDGPVTVARLESAREIVSQESRNHPAVFAARSYADSIEKVIELFGLHGSFAIMLRMLNSRKLPFGAGEGGISKTPHVSQDEDG